MKFLSISIIAVAIAAISGSVLAAPCALPEHESVINLFKRQPQDDYQIAYRHAAEAWKSTAEAWTEAATAAEKTSQDPTIKHGRQYWRTKAATCRNFAQEAQKKANSYITLSAFPKSQTSQTQSLGDVENVQKDAEKQQFEAKKILNEAVHDCLCH